MDVTPKDVTFHFEKMVGHVIDKIFSWITTIIRAANSMAMSKP